LLKITIAGARGSGKSWASMLIQAALAEITGARVTVSGEDMAEHAIAQRKFQLMAGAIKQPLMGQDVHIEQVSEARDAVKAKGRGGMESQARALAERLEELERYLPPGPRREAFAEAYRTVNETIDHLERAKTL